MMDALLPSAGRAFWLLLRLRMRRLVNMGGSSFRRRRSAGRSRPATAGRHGVRTLILLMLAGFMMTAFVSMASGTLLNLHCHLDTTRNCAALAPSGQHASSAELAAAPFSAALASAVSLELFVLLLVAVMLPLGSKELANADWDLEWLVTLPMRRATLLWSRVAERTVGTLAGWLTVWPLALMVAWHSGYRWSAPLLALLATLPLLLIASAIRTVADTGLRLRLAPSQLRKLQAIASVASLPLMYFVMSLSMPNAALTMGWAARAPAWLVWTPPGLIVQSLNARSAPAAAAFALLGLAQAGLLVLLCMQVLHRMLANGIVATSSRETGRARVRPSGSDPAFRFGTPLQRRELRLLSRDRNFLVQSLLLPVIIVGTQLIFNGTIDKASDLGADPRVLSVLAFAIGSYVLLLSAFQTLNREGQALWLLYTFPRSLESVLKEKGQLWAVLATAYPLAIFGIGLAFAARLDLNFICQIILVLASIPIFTLIAVSLGVWASDPLAEEASHRVRPTFAYAYFALCSFYSFALYTDVWHVKLAVIVLITALALSLWQKACDALPYLLDITASPPPRVSAADGMIATLLFFVLQVLALFILQGPGHSPGLAEITIAFAVGGGVTWLLARLIYWRTRATGVPVILSANHAAAFINAAIMAAIAIAASALYLYALRRLGITLPGLPRTLTWILPLAILAAPLFEEFIFRGLIFGGLRRSMPLAAAMVASAAIFAVVHPPTSMLPVFILGLCTAWAYERSKSLLSPMLTHALYNAAMLALQY